jgi:protein AFG1
MLMDLFYESLPQSMAKRRIHFHQFMIDAHKRMHAFKLLTHKPSGMVMSAATAATAVVAKKVAGEAAAAPLLGEEVDPIPTVARELAQEYEVLCFDEFQVRRAPLHPGGIQAGLTRMR